MGTTSLWLQQLIAVKENVLQLPYQGLAKTLDDWDFGHCSGMSLVALPGFTWQRCDMEFSEITPFYAFTH